MPAEIPETYANCRIPAGTYTGYWDDHINRDLGEDAENITSKLIIPPYSECSRIYYHTIPYEKISITSWSVSLVDKDGVERQYDLAKSVRFMCYYDFLYIIKDYLIDYEILAEWYTGVRIEYRGFPARGMVMTLNYKDGQLVSTEKDVSVFLQQSCFFSLCSWVVLDKSKGMVIFNHDN